MWFSVFTLWTLITSCISASTLDLSHRHLQKEAFFLQIQKAIDLKQVTDLILQDNEFDSFLDCSTNLENLRTLDLSHNHLQRFFFLCKDEYNLQLLNVSHNKLEYIDDNALNEKIPKLKILDLSFNRLAIVNETMLIHLKILEFLSLANNPIGDGIHAGAFSTLQALKHLDLRNVSAPYFPPVVFKPLTNLTTLDLSWNPVSAIPPLPSTLEELDVSGTEIPRIQGLYLPRLRELRMNRMPNLTALLLNDLDNLTSLETLSIVSCQRLVYLKVLPAQVGTLLPRLQRLSLTGCAVQTIGADLQPVVQRLAVVDLHNNPWKCDCRLQWLHEVKTAELSREVRCSSPGRHYGKLLSEIPQDELLCESSKPTFYTVLWSCILILAITLIVLGVFLLSRSRFGSWVVRRRSRETVAYTNVIESSNDLVRILAVGETGHDRNDE